MRFTGKAGLGKVSLVTAFLFFFCKGLLSAAPSQEPLSRLLFQFEEEHYDDFSAASVQEWEVWVRELKIKTGDDQDFRGIFKLWQQFLFSGKKIQFENSTDPNLSRLDKIIENRRANRLGLVSLVAALAQELDLPFHAVLAPGMPFLRFEDKAMKKDIEVGSRFSTYEEAYFLKSSFFRKEWISKDSPYFRDLSDPEILALQRCALAGDLMEKKNAEMSRELLEEAARDFPNEAGINSGLANLEYQRGNREAAILKYRDALRFSPNEETALRRLGKIYWQEGDLGQAKLLFERMLEAGYEEIDVFKKLAVIQILRGDPYQAENDVRAVLEQKAEDPEALAYLAMLQYFRGEVSEYEQNLKKAVGGGENDAGAQMALGVRQLFRGVSIDEGFFWKAMKHFRKAETLDPDNWLNKYLIGLIYLNVGQYERARVVFEEVLKTSPRSSDAWLALAQTWGRLEDYELARKCIGKAYVLEPESAEVYYSWAVLFFYEMRFREAIVPMERAIQKAPAFFKSRWRVFLARVYSEAGEIKKSQEILEGLFNESWIPPQAYQIKGQNALKEDHLEEAEEMLLHAATATVQNQETLKELAQVYFKKKDYGKAWHYIRAAQRKGVQDPEFMARLHEVSEEPEETKVDHVKVAG